MSNKANRTAPVVATEANPFVRTFGRQSIQQEFVAQDDDHHNRLTEIRKYFGGFDPKLLGEAIDIYGHWLLVRDFHQLIISNVGADGKEYVSLYVKLLEKWDISAAHLTQAFRLQANDILATWVEQVKLPEHQRKSLNSIAYTAITGLLKTNGFQTRKTARNSADQVRSELAAE